MTEPLLDGFQRLHPLSPLLRVGIFIVAGLIASWQQVLQDFNLQAVGLSVLAFCVIGLVYGFLVWWFTRFRIDTEELRIDSGVLLRRSRRISIDRLQAVDVVQPLLARLFGMAELRFEVAGGSRTEAPLAYLRLDDAYRLREILLERDLPDTRPGVAPTTPPQPSAPPGAAAPSAPHSPHTSPAPGAAAGSAAEPVHTPGTSAVQAQQPRQSQHPQQPATARPEHEIAQVDPVWLIVGTLLSTEFIVAVAVAVFMALSVVASGNLAGLTVVLPAMLGAGSVLVRGIVNDWGFVLSDTGRGWRLRSGLFDLRSQTVPLDRVQGIALVEPLLWRPLGWVKVQVDVAGYFGTSARGERSASTLLPVATRPVALAVLSRLVPGGPATDVPQRPAPRTSRVLRPVGWRYLGVGAAGPVVVTTRGWVKRRTDIVPLRKIQSLRVRQGPVQRRLGLVDVRIQTTPGPVDAIAKNRDQDEISEWVSDLLAQASRARSEQASL